MNQERYHQLDLLRIIATISVIIIHVNYQFFQHRYQTPQFEMNYLVQSSLNLITRFSVPVFVMLSGYFILNNPSNADIKAFYQKNKLQGAVSDRNCSLHLLPFFSIKCIFEGGKLDSAFERDFKRKLQ